MIGERTDVLDKGWIELVDFMPHPATGISGDLAIVNAARTSYLGESKGDTADKKLLFYLMKNRHTTPFEMVEFKFRIRAPLVTMWQWVRSRTWSFNAQSGRYTEFKENDFYMPDSWRRQAKDNKQSSDGEIDNEDSQILDDMLKNHYESSYNLYEQAVKFGVAREEARLFLPAFGVYYTWVAKVDAHNLMNFMKQRMDNHAQYEIRVYADTIYEKFFKPLLPWTSEAFEQYILYK